jgi:hypothetical protein
MIFLVGRHRLRDLIEIELAQRGVSYRSADLFGEVRFSVSMDASGATRANLGVGADVMELEPSDGVANFFEFPALANDDFCTTEQWAAWWAFLDAAPCRVWNGPSRMGFPAPLEDLVYAALLSEGVWTIPVLEATSGALPRSTPHRDVSLRDIVTGGTPTALNNPTGVFRRILVDSHSTRHLLWVAGQLCDIASPHDHIDDPDLAEALAPIASVLSSHAVGAALIVVQQGDDGAPELLAVRSIVTGLAFEHKQQFAVRAIASFLTT